MSRVLIARVLVKCQLINAERGKFDCDNHRPGVERNLYNGTQTNPRP